jgi:peptidyl-dipeptidase A
MALESLFGRDGRGRVQQTLVGFAREVSRRSPRPEPRSEQDFDAGAKYHVAANVPYARYFLPTSCNSNFIRALCKEAGYSGPLNRCSIYGNKAAGAKLNAMLGNGQEQSRGRKL